MGVEENKTLAREWFARCYAGNLEAIDELVAEAYVGQFNGDPPLRGREALRQGNAATRAGFPDIHVDVEDLLAEGDTVAVRWTAQGHYQGELPGGPAPEKPVIVTGITIFRLADDKLEESWLNWDTLGLLQQLGIVPTPGQAQR